jgi:hypothetical protein
MKKACFSDALIGDDALAVEAVLNAGVEAASRAEVHQNPGVVPRSCGILLSIAIWLR